MELKNLFSGASLTLPDDLLWSDEHSWSPVASSVSYLITGALLVQSALRQAGRAITLVGAADMAWVQRGSVNVLRDWATAPLGDNSGRFELAEHDGAMLASLCETYQVNSGKLSVGVAVKLLAPVMI